MLHVFTWDSFAVVTDRAMYFTPKREAAMCLLIKFDSKCHSGLTRLDGTVH